MPSLASKPTRRARCLPRRSVAISGLQFFVGELFDHTKEPFTGWQHRLLKFGTKLKAAKCLLALARSDVWYTIGEPKSHKFLEATARILRKPRVMHWVGTDIQVARENPELVVSLKKQHVVHLAEVEWTAKELHEMGLAAHIAPLPPRLMASDLPPMPDLFTVLLYIPRSRAYFYGSPLYEALIRSLQKEKLRFLVVGGGSLNTDAQAPIENLGFQDSMGVVYPQCSVLLRIPERDGLSLMVLEALAFGRYVVWPQVFPFVNTVSDYASIEKTIRELHARHLAGTLPLQIAASRFVNERYTQDRCLLDIADAWEHSVLTRQARRRRNGTVRAG